MSESAPTPTDTPVTPPTPAENQGDPNATPQPTPETPASTPETTENPGTEGDGDSSIEGFPEEAQRMIRELRRENAAERVNAKQEAAQEAQDELISRLGKALGLTTDDSGDEAPTVESLSEQVEQERNAAKSAILELEIFKAAGSHNLDPNALLDSRKFMQQVENLDPSGTDFHDSLKSILSESAKDSRFAVSGQVPPRSSSEHPGRHTPSSSGENMTPDELAGLVEERLGFGM